MKTLLLVGAGGFAGSILRYLVSVWMMPLSERAGLPFGTLAVNVVGSLAIGFLLFWCQTRMGHLLLIVGLCGGFTTFSTFSLEVVNLLRAGTYGSAVFYIAASLCLSVLAVWAGMYAGDKICGIQQ